MEPNNPEEETHEEEACCCGTILDNELEMRDNIREFVLHRMAIYDSEDIAKVLGVLAMYPSFATVAEVVCSIKEYIDEVEED